MSNEKTLFLIRMLFVISMMIQVSEHLYLELSENRKKNGYFLILLGWLFSTVIFLFHFHFIVVCFLFVFYFLHLQHWRGNFNGGSDFMSIVVLTGLLLSSNKTYSQFESAGIWYIAIQSLISYFVAGVVKIRVPQWRSGNAISGFLAHNINLPKKFPLKFFHKHPFLNSWVVMIWEISFPLTIINPHLAIMYISLGMTFHLGVAYTFGLNRFFWSWLATYPAIISFAYHFSD